MLNQLHAHCPGKLPTGRNLCSFAFSKTNNRKTCSRPQPFSQQGTLHTLTRVPSRTTTSCRAEAAIPADPTAESWSGPRAVTSPQPSAAAPRNEGTQARQWQRPAAGGHRGEEPLIELRNVWKTFGNKTVLKGANIKIYRGEAVGIIGGSGTGKSTTLRLMAGLLMPDQGQVFIKGRARHGLLSDDPEIGKLLNVGMVFQNGALFDSLTVGQNVGFLLYEHTKLPLSKVQGIVADALASVGLSGVEDLMPSELSGGMRKRVALARAIVRDNDADNPDQVVMYDEPTAGLDPVASTVVEDLVRSLRVTSAVTTPGAEVGESGGIAAYIVVTHQHSTIRRSVDRLIFLHEGAVVWEGPVEEFDTTTEAIVRQFASGALDGPIKYE